jgi:hypothetical protein
MAIAGGSALLLVVVLVLAFSRGDSSNKTSVASKQHGDKGTGGKGDSSAKHVEGSETGGDETGTGASANVRLNGRNGATGENGAELGSDSAAGSGDETGTTDETGASEATGEEGDGADATTNAATSTTATTGTPGAKTGGTKTGGTKTGGAKTGGAKTIGGKQVVLEYDSQAREAKAVPNNAAKADQAAIAKARQSYAAGNQRLFAGDADGAIRYYKQSLGYYPGYVAGYRGLGLAYSQQGNKPAAVQAFRTYVSSVPTAKDAALIRKRITTLQGK